MRLSDGTVEVLFQNNPKRGNVNIKVLELDNERYKGIFGLYNEHAYSIYQHKHSSGELRVHGETFQVIKRTHQRHRDCWSLRKVDEGRFKGTLRLL